MHKFRVGISESSCGRFGGYRDFVFDETGLLCWNVSDREIKIDFDHGRNLNPRSILRFNPGYPYSMEKSSNWVCRTWHLRQSNGRQLATIHQSLLSPGVLFDINSSAFNWESLDAHAYRIAFLSKQQKLKVVEPYHYCHTLGHIFDTQQELSSPWIVAWPNNEWRVPLLFVFENPPISVESIIRAQRFLFKGAAGKIAVMPLFGLGKPHWQKASDMQAADRRELKQKAELWAAIMMAYPVDCREEFAFDKTGEKLSIRNTIDFVTFKGKRTMKPRPVTPLPPVLTMARLNGYPIELSAQPLGLNLPVRYGYYDAVPGKTLTYTIPACRYCHETTAPVRAKNDPAAEKLTKRLATYLANPTLTFGGDETPDGKDPFDPNNIQDILHNLRVLGWACWSLPDKQRQRLFNKMARNLKGFDHSSYVLEKEPTSGQSYLWEKNLWRGDLTNVDLEWYNGMQLAGLWSYVYFGNDPKANLAKVRAKWDIVKGLFAYFDIWNDWATGSTWTCVTGRSLHMDGHHFAWHGIIGAARLAKMVGDTELQLRAEYYATKMMMVRYGALFSARYGREFLPYCPVAAQMQGKKGAKPHLFFSSYFERGRIGVEVQPADSTAANAVSSHVPELLLFYWDHPQACKIIRDFVYKYFPAARPNWTRLYTRSADGRGPEKPHHICAAHSHFYELDMWLMARAMLFREPLDKLLSYSADLTGHVMENYLVGSRPIAVIPTDLRFLGHEYDSATKHLSLKLEADARQKGREYQMRIWTRRRPRKINGCLSWHYDRAQEMAWVKFQAQEFNHIEAFF